MTDSTALTFTTTVAAPLDIVYRAWTNHMHVLQWLCDAAHVNAQVGRPFLFQWNRQQYHTAGEFLTLDPAGAIAFTWYGRGEPGPSQVDIELRDTDDGTAVTLTHSGLGAGDAWADTRDEIDRGWSYSLSNLKQVLETGLDRRVYDQPFTGVFIAGLVSSDDLAQAGVAADGGIRLAGTAPGGGAADAGLAAGDVIIKINNQPVSNFPAWQSAMSGVAVGDAVPFQYVRDGAVHDATVTMAQRPAPNMPDDPAAFAEQVRAQYAGFVKTLDELAASTNEDAAAHKPDDGWSVKEILAHLLTTERALHTSIGSNESGTILRGWPNNPPAWTAAFADTHTFAALASAYRHALDETVAILAHLPASVVSDKATYYAIGQFVLGLAGHIQSHLNDMQQALAAA